MAIIPNIVLKIYQKYPVDRDDVNDRDELTFRYFKA